VTERNGHRPRMLTEVSARSARFRRSSSHSGYSDPVRSLGCSPVIGSRPMPISSASYSSVLHPYSKLTAPEGMDSGAEPPAWRRTDLGVVPGE
jgi:hypothetical protein